MLQILVKIWGDGVRMIKDKSSGGGGVFTVNNISVLGGSWRIAHILKVGRASGAQ